MCTEPDRNLRQSLSLNSMNTSTQIFASHFIGLCLCSWSITQGDIDFDPWYVYM